MSAPARLRPSLGRRGFTIVELLLALLALAAIVSLAIPMYFDQPEISLENAAVQLAEDLRVAQNRAAYLGRVVTVEFDDDGHGYRTIESALSGPRASKARRYDADGVFEGVWIRAAEFGADGPKLRFDPRGRAVTGGRVELVFRGESRHLALEQGSGRISIEDSTSGWVDDGL
jgi:prepilin-type N-terminal cleavage/methylation domain-containing protein